MSSPKIAYAAILTLFLAVSARAQEPPVGTRIRSLPFTDRLFLPRDLSAFGDAEALVVVLTGVECPIVRRYLPRLSALEARFHEKGVRFLALGAVPGEGVVELGSFLLDRGTAFPFGVDFTGAAVRALGGSRLGQVFVLDQERRLRYRGRIDSEYRLAGTAPTRGRADLEEALNDILAGRDVAVPETPVDGCALAPRPNDPPRAVTYHRDVESVLSAHCVACHRAGSVAPLRLDSLDAARRNAGMLREVVEQKRMPPWFADPAHDEFVNKPTITDEERRILSDWVRLGTPAGDQEAAKPAETSQAPEWEIGPPDLILKPTGPLELPAEGYIPYQLRSLLPEFEEDTWISAIQIRPSNRRVVHHANLFYSEAGRPVSSSGFITSLLPGSTSLRLPKGVALRIPKRSRVHLQLHYVASGEKEKDWPEVGIRFARGDVQQQLRHLAMTDFEFVIGAHAQNAEVVAENVLPGDGTGLWTLVHMHLRGKDATIDAQSPDGSTARVLRVPSYSFDWQSVYSWGAKGPKFKKGTTFRLTAHFDNSAFNALNPDPTSRVGFGYQTFHEMAYGFVYYVLDDERLGYTVDPLTGRRR